MSHTFRHTPFKTPQQLIDEVKQFAYASDYFNDKKVIAVLNGEVKELELKAGDRVEVELLLRAFRDDDFGVTTAQVQAKGYVRFPIWKVKEFIVTRKM